MACGRYIGFFLTVLIEKKRGLYSGEKGREMGYLSQRGGRFEMDEEVLAYLSADLQGTDDAWVWQGREAMGMRSPAVSGVGGSGVLSPILGSGGERDREMSGMSGLSGGFLVLREKEAMDWGGWERVQYLVDVLARESGVSGSALGPIPGPGHIQGSAAYIPESRSAFGLGLGVGSNVGVAPLVGGPVVAAAPIGIPQTSPPAKRDERNRGNERMSITNII